MMYSQNDKTGVLEVLEIKIFFTAQPWWVHFKKKKFFNEFYTWVIVSNKFLKKVKNL